MRTNALVHIEFPDPGFFIGDARIELKVNGQPVYDGSFKGGFVRGVELAPGSHELVGFIHLPGGIGLARMRRWQLEIQDTGEYRATIRYSRMWGNFKKKLRFEPVTGAAPIEPS